MIDGIKNGITTIQNIAHVDIDISNSHITKIDTGG